jgi:hypothetical protein
MSHCNWLQGVSRHAFLSLLLLVGSLPLGCSNPEDINADGSGLLDVMPSVDGNLAVCSDPNGDDDLDGIPNGSEGCLTGRDSDKDKVPDWLDTDSDDDKIPDSIEKGSKSTDGKCSSTKAPKNTWPCDTDGDQYPDYLDEDSDGDGLKDGDEDLNHDGLVGCCISTCKTYGSSAQQKNCTLQSDGCYSGQKCVSGKCTPAVAFACSNGETNPYKKDTFGDGKMDNERGTFICRDATEDNPKGRKAVSTRGNKTGDFNVAYDPKATVGDITIASAGTKDAAIVIDDSSSTSEVAGFVVSTDSTEAKVTDELSTILASLNTKWGSNQVTVTASGTTGHSHDLYDTVFGTILDFNLSSSSNPADVRSSIIAAILGKNLSDLSNLPSSFGTSTTSFVVRLLTIKRIEFKKDSQGYILDEDGNRVKDTGKGPADGGDKTKWRLIVAGAVAAKSNYNDSTKKTGFVVDDLSNGTSVAIYTDTLGNQCDVGTVSSLPIADIIWVIDESGSMEDNRKDIQNNANNFFSRALSSGLDFRMGVTNVCDPSYGSASAIGKFCSKVSSDANDDGGTDRFLEPSEQSTFSSCIYNPPGYEGGSEYGLVNAKAAVSKHLPRATGDSTKIRSGAKLVIIVASDEVPNEIYNVISNYSPCTLSTTDQSKLDSWLQTNYLDYFEGVTDSEAVATFHSIVGTCSNSCGADVGHGYSDLAQALSGQVGDVCQKDLGTTLQVIIDSIVGEASPVTLTYTPISASLAVTLDSTELTRSRSSGFDYRYQKNSLAFINVKYKKGSQVIASYKRWERQVTLQ